MQHVLRVLSHKGDDPVTWVLDDAAAVQVARMRFEELVERHYAIFSVAAEGTQERTEGGLRVERFDPRISEYLAIPQITGG